ncbi:MAG: GNAT family N-acetyltransferase [Hyphomicrobiaceae bacterium]
MKERRRDQGTRIMSRISIEPANRSDEAELRAMQVASFRILGRSFYDDDVIEGFIADIGTMDDNLLLDGSYFKAVANGRILGSGGWSWRTPAYASHVADIAPGPHVAQATVRSIFVHPEHAGRGIGRELMAAIEQKIAAAGFGTASLMATLCGIPFYRRLGYRNGRPVALRLPNAQTFVGMEMEKLLVVTTVEQDKAA